MNGLENNMNVNVIYIDFSKAYDKADIGILTHKIRAMGFEGKLGQWIQDFHHDRTEFVIANNKLSRPELVTSGVPQGSVLGPLLFLLVIDSIAEIDLDSKVGIFADDTRAVCQIMDEDDTMILQDDLDKLCTWAIENNMAFNGSKFECIKYGPNLDLKANYHYSNPEVDTCIDDKSNLRDLDIQISKYATYDEHIGKVIKKAKQKTAWINRTFMRNDILFRKKLW